MAEIRRMRSTVRHPYVSPQCLVASSMPGCMQGSVMPLSMLLLDVYVCRSLAE